MTFDPNADISGGKVSRRGRTTGIAAGGVGLGAVAIFLISQLLGVDLTGLAGGDAGGGTQQVGTGDALVNCDTGADANASVDCRMKGAAASLEAYWSQEMPAARRLVLVAPVHPLHRPDEHGMRRRDERRRPVLLPARPDAVRRHGLLRRAAHPLRRERRTRWPRCTSSRTSGATTSRTSPGSWSSTPAARPVRPPTACGRSCRRTASRAAGPAPPRTTKDAKGHTFLEPITDAQIADALSAAAAVGDDRIQQASTGRVRPGGLDARLGRGAPARGSRPATARARPPATRSRCRRRASERPASGRSLIPCAPCTPRSSRTTPACSRSATASRSTGRPAATPTASPSCSCTAGRAAAPPRPTGGCSTRSGTASCSSTSATAAAACRTPATRRPT